MLPASSRPLHRILAARILATLAAGAALAACGPPPPLAISVQLVSVTCGSSSKDILALAGSPGSTVIQTTIFGDGITTPIQTSATVSSNTLNVPNIPLGTNRNIVVEVLNTSNVPVARGESGPFDVLSKEKTATETIFIRPVDSFEPANGAANPNVCTTLINARAGHTATTLENGTVLIAGGYSQASSSAMPNYLSTSEIYNPPTGAVTQGPQMIHARAFHTATHLPGTNYTLIAGGEAGAPGSAAGGALQIGELYDENANTFTEQTMTAARTRAIAGVPLAFASGAGGQPGFVLVMGGNNPAGKPISSYETFSPSSGFQAVSGDSLPSPRSEGTAVPVPGGVLIVGGWDGTTGGTKVVTGVTSPDNAHFSAWKTGPSLSTAHVFPLAATLGDGSVVVMDGLSSPQEPASPLALSTAIDVVDVLQLSGSNWTVTTPTSMVPTYTRAFGNGIALPNGKMLVVGGGDGSTDEALSKADLMAKGSGSSATVEGADTSTSMAFPRINSASTLLQDGTVLVTGGLGTSNGIQTINSVEVYTPNYQISGTNPHD